MTRLRVTENFFPLLGVRPQPGRIFTSEEAQDYGPGAVLLSHSLWVRRFGADPDIVGNSLTLNEAPITVVGVLPASFDFNAVFAHDSRIDFVAPFPLTERTNRQGNTLALIGRLRPGITIEAAQAEATRIAEWILGFEKRGAALRIDPCIPREWKGFEIVYRHGHAVYRITVENPSGVSRGVSRVTLDGTPLPADGLVPLVDDAGEHQVQVVLG